MVDRRDLLTIHTTGGITGSFRKRRGAPLEAEVTVHVADRHGVDLSTYSLWRPATDDDHIEAAFLSVDRSAKNG